MAWGRQKNTRRKIKKQLIHEWKPISEYIIEGIIVLASLVVSLITAVASIVGRFDAFQTIATTMLSFLCAEYLGHSILEKSKYFKAKKEYSLVEQSNEWTGLLYEVNEYCKTILENSHGSQDLFVVTCRESIDKLHYFLQTAARDEKIEISSDYIVNSVGVFEALNVSSEKTVELTFPIDEIKDGVLQTPEDKKFFETACKMVKDGYVQTIKVLLILGDMTLINDPRLMALCTFYDTTDGFEGKYISKEDFVKACESNMVSSSQLDFGIYGPRMLFKVESYEPYKGVYIKSADEVQRYHKLFEEMWNFPSITHELPNTAASGISGSNPMSLPDLFNLLAEKMIVTGTPNYSVANKVATVVFGEVKQSDGEQSGATGYVQDNN